MKKNILFYCGIFLFISKNIYAQGVYAPLNQDYYHLIDRYEIKNNRAFFTSFKPYERARIVKLLDSLKIETLSKSDIFNINYLKKDNWDYLQDTVASTFARKKIIGIGYEQPQAAYSVNSKDFTLVANPVINFEQNNINKAYPLSMNTRGLELRGMIAKKIGFYTFITDNQAFAPNYISEMADSVAAFPGEGFTKAFKKTGYDFFSARGYISFNIVKPISVQFGHDKNFIGNGYRSLMLSDNSSKYLFLKVNTKVWKLNYTNLFTEMTGQVINNNTYNPRKYMAMHHLGFQVTRNLNIGIFENIVFQRQDSTTGNRGFELNYLNPIIFYREVESYLGSEDKTGVGADFKWNFLNHFSIYGQLVLNELSVRNLAARNGWWGNKYAYQIGVKYIDVFGIKNLDLQGEYNLVRPYMYTDKIALTNFSNYGQPTAHPLGANFKEYIGILRYQPIGRLNFTAKAILIQQGKDMNGLNYGSDIFRPGYNPVNQFGNKVGQGLTTDIMFLAFNASYQLFHNFFIDVKLQHRVEKNIVYNREEQIITGGIRWNLAARNYEF